MVDFAGGHPSTEDAAEVIARPRGRSSAGDGISFHPGVQYRHIMVAPAAWPTPSACRPTTSPTRPAVWPTGPAAGRLTDLMERVAGRSSAPRRSPPTRSGSGGRARSRSCRRSARSHGVEAGLVTAVDLVRGLGVLTGMESSRSRARPAGTTPTTRASGTPPWPGWRTGSDLFVIHVEATDEAGHAGDLDEKIAALEHWDRRILADLVDGLDAIGPWRLLLLPDHPTPVALKTHTTDPVPYLLVDSATDGPGGVYTEAGDRGLPSRSRATSSWRRLLATTVRG